MDNKVLSPHVIKKSRSVFQQVVFYGILVIGAFIMLVPFLWMISTSLKPTGTVMTMPPQLIPSSITFDNFVRVKDTFPIDRFLFNSFVVATASTFGTLLLSSMAAYVFSRMEFKGRDVIFMVYLATLMVPSQVTMIPQFILMKYLGWLNSYPGLIVPGMFSAFGTFLLRQFFLTIPKSLDEAAFIDGAGHFRVYWQIILPLARPAMATLAVFSFMQSWNSYLWPLIMVSDRSMMTLPLGLSTIQGRWTTDWNLLMAGVVISVIPILMVYLLAQKHFIQGITLSGLKE